MTWKDTQIITRVVTQYLRGGIGGVTVVGELKFDFLFFFFFFLKGNIIIQ